MFRAFFAIEKQWNKLVQLQTPEMNFRPKDSKVEEVEVAIQTTSIKKSAHSDRKKSEGGNDTASPEDGYADRICNSSCMWGENFDDEKPRNGT